MRVSVACLFSVILGALGCAEDLEGKGIGEPCTRTSQCERGLSCVAGACAEPDAGVSDGGPDGPPADAPASD
jgi:hypothetical protein